MKMSKFKTKSNRIEDMWKEQENNSKIHYLPRGVVPVILVMLFIFSDYIFISQLIDNYFYDAAWKGVVGSCIISVIIDVSPTFFAAFIMSKSKKLHHYISFVLLLCLDLSIFAFLGVTRLNSADLIFSTGSTSLVSATNSVTESTVSAGQTALSWLFIVLPMATSVLSFIVGIMSDSKSNEKYINKKWKAKVQNMVADDEAAKIELKDVIDRQLGKNTDEKHKLAVDNVIAEELITYDKLKLMHAMACRNPQATSEIFSRKIEMEE